MVRVGAGRYIARVADEDPFRNFPVSCRVHQPVHQHLDLVPIGKPTDHAIALAVLPASPQQASGMVLNQPRMDSIQHTIRNVRRG